ncbi:uncharacterized protein LOC144452881 [Glandiceps talaboti]
MASRRICTLFNFFESYGKQTLPEFLKSWRGTTETFLLPLDNFIRTQLHGNLDQSGGASKYLYFNYGHFTNDQFVGFRPELATPEWISEIKDGIQKGYVAYPGGFQELATADGNPMSPDLPKKDTSLFLVTNYKVTEGANLEDLEATWQDWTGLTSFKENADLGFSNAGLYKRFSDERRSPFQYVMRAEFTELGAKTDEGWKLVEKVRNLKVPDKITADTSLYKAISECIYEGKAN